MRVRVKELAQEAKFIRHEEIKAKPRDREEFWKLRNHRVVDVRNAARAALLAYAFLRGKEYKSMEKVTHDPDWKLNPIWKEVKRLSAKFGGKNYNEEIDKWFNL